MHADRTKPVTATTKASANDRRLQATVVTFSSLAADALDGQSLRIRDLVSHLGSRWAIHLAGHSLPPEDALHRHIARYCPLAMNSHSDLWHLHRRKTPQLIRVLRQVNLCAAQSDILYTDFMYANYARLLGGCWPGNPRPRLVMEVNGIVTEEARIRGLPADRPGFELYKRIERSAFRLADRLIVVADSIKRYLEGECHVPSGRICVIPNGVEPAFIKDTVSGETVRAQYGLGQDPVVLFHGSFQAWHGVERLTEAWPGVLAKVPNARLLLVGDGPVRVRVEQMCHEAGLGSSLILAGKQPKARVPDFIAAADVCAYYPAYDVPPYGFLGNPLKVLEYMSGAKPIVTTDLPGFSELVRKYDCGLTTDQTSEAFAAGLVRLLKESDRAERLGQNGRRAVERELLWPHIAKQIHSVCTELVPRSESRYRPGEAPN